MPHGIKTGEEIKEEQFRKIIRGSVTHYISERKTRSHMNGRFLLHYYYGPNRDRQRKRWMDSAMVKELSRIRGQRVYSEWTAPRIFRYTD